MEIIDLPDYIVFAKTLEEWNFDDLKNFAHKVLQIPAGINENAKGIKHVYLSIEGFDMPFFEHDTLIVSKTLLGSNIEPCVEYITLGRWHLYIIRPAFVTNLIASLLLDSPDAPTLNSTILDSLFKDYTIVGVENERVVPLPSKLMIVHKESGESIYSVKSLQHYNRCL